MSARTIVHVLSSFGLGGQERVALELARTQLARGHRVLAVSLAGSPEGPLGATFRALGVSTQSFSKSSGVDASLPVKIAGFLRDEQADIVHTHNPHALIYGAPGAGLARVKVVHSKHGINPGETLDLWLRRTAARFVDAFVAVTPMLARIATERSECEPSRLHVVPNGIDTTHFAPNAQARREVRDELGIPQSAWVVGTVGRLAPEKDQALLIRALGPILDERRHLVIVGEGPERGVLERARDATLRAEFCHLVGARDDVRRYLAAFDVFALTSRMEGLPLGLLEAMATGLPVVSTSVGGIPDLIEHGVTGLLVASGDEAELTRELVTLATRPTAGLQVGHAGREVVLARHSLTRMADAYESLYEKVLGRSERPAAPSRLVEDARV